MATDDTELEDRGHCNVEAFQDDPEDLRVQVFGSNRYIPVKTNSHGQVEVVTVPGSSVNVTATDLDIRNLSSATDSVTVTGNVGIIGNVNTTAKVLRSTDGQFSTIEINASNLVSFPSTPIDVSDAQSYQFYVRNMSDCTILIWFLAFPTDDLTKSVAFSHYLEPSPTGLWEASSVMIPNIFSTTSNIPVKFVQLHLQNRCPQPISMTAEVQVGFAVQK